jgi:membrane-associated phospholipid phosphatase
MASSPVSGLSSSWPGRDKWLLAISAFLFFALLAPCAKAKDPDRVEWSTDWPKFRLAEGITTVGLASATVAFDLMTPAEHPNWRGGILFDNWVRDNLRSQNRETQERAADVSDYIYKGSLVIPSAIDIGVVTLGIHGRPDVAWQMLLIHLQSFAIAGALSVGSEHLVARARPYTADCGADGLTRDKNGQPLLNACGGSQDNLDFFSGHTAAASTMAGLTCVHHQHLPLYGGGFADLAPCIGMIGASIADGVGRIVADRHYASDVTLGWGVGAFAGYVVPSLLHYGFTSNQRVPAAGATGLRMVPLPQVYQDGLGVGVVGIF